MIKFCNGEFEAERDQYQWILTRWVDSTSKKGEPIKKARVTYHTSLQQVCNAVINKVGDKCEEMDDFVTLLENAQELLHKEASKVINGD